jgi:hypothetical protein
VWGKGYTELFFLDEVTALAAGHRPCFECRRSDATAFAAAFAGVGRSLHRQPASAMDVVLHAERLDGRAKRLHRARIDDLPDGTFVTSGEGDAREALAIRGTRLLAWTPAGYAGWLPRPSGAIVDVLTPPSIIPVLASGYRPAWHPSAQFAESS